MRNFYAKIIHFRLRLSYPCFEMDQTVKQLADASLSLSLHVNRLCESGEDLFFYGKLNSNLKELIQSVGDKTFESVKNVLKFRFNRDLHLEQQEWLQKDFEGRNFVDLVDAQLEKIDSILDSCKNDANKKSGKLAVKPIVAHVTLPAEYGKRKQFSIIHALNIPRPQLSFLDPPDNSPIQGLPKLAFPKPNCTCQKEFALQVGVHPYEWELKTFQYPGWALEQETEILFHPIHDTSFTFIEDEQQLNALVDRISAERVIAVDLEHHNYRSFEGFVCLMQLSTRTEDFIIDTIACRSFMHKLNGIFTNPFVLKIFHGAESDIIWLQRDFGVYVVGMFDTYFASKLLSLGGNSLSHLVRHYGGIELDKKFQLADWRIRPLPKEMLDYARGDTHYLLYIWDRIRNDLLKQGKRGMSFMKQILASSNKRCQLLYVKEKYNENEWKSIAGKYNKPLNNRQVAVIKGMLQWRDTVARMEDESLHYVMPKTMIIRIAESLPNSASGIMRCFTPCPPLVKQHAHDLLLIIRNKINESDLATSEMEQALKEIVLTKSKHVIFETLPEEDEVSDGVQSMDIENDAQSDKLKLPKVSSINSNSVPTESTDSLLTTGETAPSKPAFIGRMEIVSESTTSRIKDFQKLRVSVAQEPKKVSIFDEEEDEGEDENNNLGEQPFAIKALSNAFNPAPPLTPITKSSLPSTDNSLTKQIPVKPKSVVKMVNSSTPSQPIDDKFVASLKKPKLLNSFSSNPPPSSIATSVDLAQEYNNSLSKTKQQQKIPDFDPNSSSSLSSSTTNEPKSSGKKKKYSKRAQKSTTFSISKSK